MIKFMEGDKIHQFLMGLDDGPYSTVRSQILILYFLPSLDKIYDMVRQEENQKRVMNDQDFKSENMAPFVVSLIAQPSNMQGEKVNCRHCGKKGNDEANCF